MIIEVLVDLRPGDLILAYEAAEKMGTKFMQQLNKGMSLIREELQQSIKLIITDHE